MTSFGDVRGGRLEDVLDPVMNMYFMRDQVITTAKGLVVGHFNAPQREVETRIARFAYARLGIVPIFEVSGETAFQGQGCGPTPLSLIHI